MSTSVRDSTHQRVSAALFDAIRQGRYRPGARISIRATAAEIGVSVTPVREALLKLEALGAIEANAGGSLHIPERTHEEIVQLYATRIALESQAAAEAAVLMSPAAISSLRGIDKAMRVANCALDLRRVLELNEQFHFTIYTAANNRTLVDLINLLWLRSGPLLPTVYGFYRATRQRFAPDGSDNDHAELIEALASGDRERVSLAMATDIQSGLDVYKAIKIDFEQGVAEVMRPSLRSAVRARQEPVLVG